MKKKMEEKDRDESSHKAIIFLEGWRKEKITLEEVYPIGDHHRTTKKEWHPKSNKCITREVDWTTTILVGKDRRVGSFEWAQLLHQ